MSQSREMLVAGTGLSGVSAIHLILECGGEVVLYGGNTALKEEDIKAKLDKEAKVNVVLRETRRSDLLGVELCIINPGIPLDSPFMAVVGDAKIPILGEIELAYRCAIGKLAAITGTNGRTTTTTLTGEILEARYRETFVVGNIGDPYTARMLDMTEESVTITEVSSFQLETIVDFHLDVSAILNITPDHLNRHGTMENCIRTKECITLNQTGQGAVVLNYDNPVLRGFGQGPELKPGVVWFSSREKLADGLCMDEGNIVHCQEGRKAALVNIHDMKLLGRHDYENVMATVAVGLGMGVSIADITRVMEGFLPVEHHIEFVQERTGVRYYNDSKGTDPDTVIQALRTMPGPTILIASGYDKNSGYGGWVSEFEGKARYVVLIGQTRDRTTECAKEYKFTGIIYIEDMQEAVQVCAVHANTRDYMLLSPACASWGMFKNCEERGRVFEECVMALQEVNACGGEGTDGRPALGPG